MTIITPNAVYNYHAEEKKNGAGGGVGEESTFEPYTHQVGGHCCILKFAGKICKPLIQREYEFYCTIHKEFPLLCSITPEFYGYLAVPKNLLMNTPGDKKKKPSSFPTSSSLHPSSSSSSTTTSTSSADASALSLGLDKDRMLGSMDIHQYYIVLTDLTAGMFKPCVMDMKMGTYRQRFDTSVLLGYRLCGMRAWRGDELYSVDRLFGRGLTTETVEDAVSAFLFDGQTMRTQLLAPLLKKLRNILGILETSPFRFYTSSLLFIYDGAARYTPPRIDVRIVDFAHAIYKNTKEGEAEDGVLFGLRNLIALFEHLQERYAALSECDSDMDTSSLDVHSDQDTEDDDDDEEDDDSASSISEDDPHLPSSSVTLLNRCAPLPLTAPPSSTTCRPLDV